MGKKYVINGNRGLILWQVLSKVPLIKIKTLVTSGSTESFYLEMGECVHEDRIESLPKLRDRFSYILNWWTCASRYP